MLRLLDSKHYSVCYILQLVVNEDVSAESHSANLALEFQSDDVLRTSFLDGG